VLITAVCAAAATSTISKLPAGPCGCVTKTGNGPFIALVVFISLWYVQFIEIRQFEICVSVFCCFNFHFYFSFLFTE
jgi:hypothetical protein